MISSIIKTTNTSMAKSEVLELTATSNPYLDFYNEFVRTHPGELTAVFDPELSDEVRSKMFNSVDVGIAMIVEMGAGSAYWARLLQLRGVDVIAYDVHTSDDNDEEKESRDNEVDNIRSAATSSEKRNVGAEEMQESGDEEFNDEGEEEEGTEEEKGEEVVQIYWTKVVKGTPKDLRKHADRTLFLCYPDDFEDSHESMAMASLCNYGGDTVIHVGELFAHTVCMPSPWGRTSSDEFQVHLATVYHKVLQVPLPSWHSSIDTLTVWKRTKSSIVDGAMYAFIPQNERIDLVAACPATRPLLLLGDTDIAARAASMSKRKHRYKKVNVTE
ncbi:hypothetical protein PsorP6_000346 [Peronosclerospora sorghi]|uniref:Uncharacterized protein n=1 Tax=Peronosclerospora sorghi TaxID=230839 RepID=A0ACC0WUI9_9STRA|nr:hypothetical protein PsorP6_000346 [Peronosclerospora sorghi]